MTYVNESLLNTTKARAYHPFMHAAALPTNIAYKSLTYKLIKPRVARQDAHQVSLDDRLLLHIRHLKSRVPSPTKQILDTKPQIYRCFCFRLILQKRDQKFKITW